MAHGGFRARAAASTGTHVFWRKRRTGLYPVDMIRSPQTEERLASTARALRLRMAAVLVRGAGSKTSRLLRRGHITRITFT